MGDLEKIKRQLSKPIPISIKNEDGIEDVFYFKPLNVEQQAILMELSKIIRERETIEVDGKKVPDVKKEDMLEMLNLIEDVVKNSIKELNEDLIELDDKMLEKEKKIEVINLRKEFCNNNFDELSEALFKLIPQNVSKKDINLIKKARELRNNEQSGKTEKV